MRAEEALEAVLEASDDAIVIVDENGQVTANGASRRWFGRAGLAGGAGHWAGALELSDPYAGGPVRLLALPAPGPHLVTLSCAAMPAPIRALVQIRIVAAGEGRVYLFRDLGAHAGEVTK